MLTLSVEIEIMGKSESKLTVSICTASMGRYGIINDANAIAKKLPKLDKIVARIYVTVFAKALRPSTIPSIITPRSCFKSTISEVSRAISEALSTTRDTFAIFSAGASFMPSPRKPTR